MRALLDASVLVAAFISRAGACTSLLEDILMDHEWVISYFILDEVAQTLKEKFGFPEAEVAQVRAFIVSAAQTVEPAEIPPESCRDRMICLSSEPL